MDVRARVLGEFEIEGLAPFQLGSRKARTLLKILALGRGRPVGVDRLIECLWPEDEAAPQRPEEQVAVLVSRLRAVLGTDKLPRTDAGYRLVYDWLDLVALEELTAAALRRMSAGSFALARTAGEAGLRLIRGPLLADEPHATWATGERAAAERLVAQAQVIVAQAALNSGDTAGAADHAAVVVESDPYDEAALRLLMEAYAASNRPALAIAAYGRARERLSDELSIEPAPPTQGVYLRILRQEPFPFAPTRLGARQKEQSHAALLPGRTRELQALDAALERAAAGLVELLLVEGEAGIGKSRVLRTWAARAAASGVQVLSANCDELERSLPLRPLADALDGYLRALPAPASVVEALGQEHAVLASLLRASPQPPQPAALDPVGGQATLFSALLAVFERLGQQALVALLLDDLHLADRASVAWLHFAARHAVGLRLLVVGALRTEEAVQLSQARRVHLGPLDIEAARMVVGDARAVELHTRSGGHRLFLVELAAVEDGALPTSLREAIGARCERAGETASSALKTAELLGPAVDLDLLSSVLGRPPLELLSHLEASAQRGLLEEHDATFVFGHELVRESLVTGIGSARRVVVHREAARTLAARPNPEPLAIAYHAREGNDFDLAATAYARAAKQAAERYDHIESERLLPPPWAFHWIMRWLMRFSSGSQSTPDSRPGG